MPDLSRAAEDLLGYALDQLGAEVEDDTLTFTDSFGRVSFQPSRSGLVREDGLQVRSRQALRENLWRGPGANRAGLLSGTVLTELGVTPFALRFQRDGRNETSMRLSLHLTRPYTFGGVMYAELHCTHYQTPTFRLCGGRWARRSDGRGMAHDLSGPMGSFLFELERRAAAVLYSPQAQCLARQEEAHERLRGVQQRIRELEQQAQDIGAEITALRAA